MEGTAPGSFGKKNKDISWIFEREIVYYVEKEERYSKTKYHRDREREREHEGTSLQRERERVIILVIVSDCNGGTTVRSRRADPGRIFTLWCSIKKKNILLQKLFF